MLDKLKSLLLYPLPHHLLTRVIFHLTRVAWPFNSRIITWFIRQFDVEMADSKIQQLSEFKTFNAFFTRELKAAARPLPQQPDSIACPADGRISALGNIDSGSLLQAKKHDYTVAQLLGGSADEAARFHNGSFMTVYLSPRDYHRVHMPVSGTLARMAHIPGRLFSVAPFTVNNVNSLFARNERVASLFDTPEGRLAVVLVGAMNVAAIETVWAGLVTPPAGKQVTTTDYRNEQPVSLDRGAEMGRFNMGSTVIILLEQRVAWAEDLQVGTPVKMGMPMGKNSPSL